MLMVLIQTPIEKVKTNKTGILREEKTKNLPEQDPLTNQTQLGAKSTSTCSLFGTAKTLEQQ
jgi:hypothetical protein